MDKYHLTEDQIEKFSHWTEINKHVSEIMVGDTMLCRDGFIRTVCRSNISYGFMGSSVFGDSFNCGSIKVLCLIIRKHQ